MIMSGKIFNKLALTAVMLLLCGNVVSGQAFGSFTPYSIYGIGDLSEGGTAYNATKGGVGIATRDNRFINPLNPAAVTARDTLAFMADFSLYQSNRTFNQADMKARNNVANIGDLIISFPIYRSSAMMVGVRPFSGTGYGYTSSYDDNTLVSQMGDITYAATGQGAVSQIFVTAGVTFFKKLSLGVEGIHYFGNIGKNYYETISEASYLGAKNGYNIEISANTLKFGLQYSQKVGEIGIVAGATYRMPVIPGGTLEAYRCSAGSAATDTLSYSRSELGSKDAQIEFPEEIGIGISLGKKDKWSLEFDYTRSDWKKSGMDRTEGFAGNLIPGSGGSVFSGTLSNSFRAGFEYIPNRGDMRYYFNNCTYRAGAYYKTEYYKLDGKDISSLGLTFGVTLPVFRWYNGVTLGVELGRRGSVRDNLIREDYVNFNIGVNLFDIWFQKPKYD